MGDGLVIVAPSERGEWWGTTDPCFYCRDEIAPSVVTVMWAGASNIAFHPACAATFGMHLISDSREADLADATGI
jgi:hypothetical protein